MKLYNILRAGLAGCVFGGVFSVNAQQPAPWQMIAQWDNDLLAGTDQDYTNGTRIAFMREFDTEAPVHNFLSKGLYWLTGADADARFHDWRFPANGALRFAAGFGLTQLMFTPENPDTLTAPAGERPYASWLGLEFSLHAKSAASVSSVTLSLGTTGNDSFGEKAQDWVHENISDSPIYQGWDSQVPGEFTLNLHFDHKRSLRFLDQTQSWPLQFDGYTEWGGAFGNLRTDAYLGSLLRAGHNLPATHSTPRVQLGSYGHALFRKEDPARDPFSILGFAGARGSAVLHDISLDGPVFRNFNTGVKSETFVGELILGLGLRYGRCDLSISRTFRTDEFKGQGENQEFGSVMFRFHSAF